MALLPWARAINGAGSVIASLLANLVMVEFGYKVLLGIAFVLYMAVAASQPDGAKIGDGFGFFRTVRR